MITVAPFYLQNYHYAVVHISNQTYIVNLDTCDISAIISGIPTAISYDEKILLMYESNNFKNNDYRIYAIEISRFVQVNISDLNPSEFPKHNQLLFRRFEISSDFPATMIFENVLESDQYINIQFSSSNSYLSHLHIEHRIFRALSSPLVAFSGTWDYDADGYGRVWLYNILSQEEVFTTSILENAPIMLNYIENSSYVTLISSDYIRLINIHNGESIIITEGKPFDRHSMWRGDAKYIDSLCHPTDSTKVVICEQQQWYFMNQGADGEWTPNIRHYVDGIIHRISIVKDNILLVTSRDIRLLNFEGRLLCTINYE